MHDKTKGIVLREAAYGDADKILTVLTRDRGKLTLKARGVRKNTSALKSACQLLAFSEFTYQEIRGYPVVTEAECLEMFPELRNDIEKISLAFYFAQVADVLSEEDCPNAEILTLLLNCLYALARLDKPQALVKTAFEWRMSCMAGYMPELSGCAVCGNEAPERFDLSNGVLLCGTCASDGIRMPIHSGALAALRFLLSCDAKRIFSFTLGEDSLRELSALSESYLMTQLEHSFPTLELYKSLFFHPNTNGESQ